MRDRALDGCVAVTFEREEDALACKQVLRGRKFDGRSLEAVLLPINIKEVEEKTEDFLNSLL